MALTFAGLAGPARYARRLRERPRWAGRFFILAALYIGLGIAGSVHRADLTAGRLPASASAQERSVARESMLDGTLVRSLFLPVRLFTGWSLFALALYYACWIWSTREKVRYVHLFAAEVHAEGAMFLGNAAALAAVFLGGGEGRPSVPWIPAGLDRLVPAGDFTLRYILNSFNIFSALYVTVLAVTVSLMLGLSRTKALISVLLAWGLTNFVNAGIFHALRAEFHLGL
ncbi:MAG TPA: hypothetical protein VJO14_08295 [Bacteroidota bacterium]|nr:hypothetical protein [Bacteroidota bacterium]